MSPTFSGAGFAGEVITAGSQDELIQVFAKYKVVPKKNPASGTGMAKSDYILERRGDEKPGGKNHAVGAETRKTLIKKLGIDSDEECKRIREKIKNHPLWRT